MSKPTELTEEQREWLAYAEQPEAKVTKPKIERDSKEETKDTPSAMARKLQAVHDLLEAKEEGDAEGIAAAEAAVAIADAISEREIADKREEEGEPRKTD